MGLDNSKASPAAKEDTAAPRMQSRALRSSAYLRAAVLPLALTAIGLTIAYLYDYCSLLHRFGQGILVYISVFSAQFMLYLSACYAVLRGGRAESAERAPRLKLITLAVILVFAAYFHAQLVERVPYLSSDVYRYIWDGRVQAAGINPYRYIPEQEELAPLRDQAIYANINRRDFAHTIYPPAAQALFLAVYLAAPSDVTAFKVAMSLLDAVTIIAIMLALMRAGLDPARVIIFAWHPLVVWEAAHSGHIESAAMAFLAAALLARSYNKAALTGAALALATLTKFYPALLLPAFMFSKPQGAQASGAIGGTISGVIKRAAATLVMRENLVMMVWFAAVVVGSYVPYLSVGAGVLGYLPGYLKEEGFVETGSRYFLLGVARSLLPLSTSLYSMLAAAALVSLCLWALLKAKRNVVDVARAATALIALFLILSSPRFGWYIAWIIPFLCFAPVAAWLYLTGAAVFLYFLWLTSDYPNIPLWLGASIYLPAVAMLVCRWMVERSANRNREPQSAL